MNHIFVFGSNLAGRHGKGAALFAKKYFGAEYGIGEGRTGMAYAIPTKGHNLETLDFKDIEESIITFFQYARQHHLVEFHLTPIGTGLAGCPKSDIWKVLVKNNMPQNVLLTSTWVTG